MKHVGIAQIHQKRLWVAPALQYWTLQMIQQLQQHSSLLQQLFATDSAVDSAKAFLKPAAAIL